MKTGVAKALRGVGLAGVVVILGLSPAPVLAFGLDDVTTMEQVEQGELLEQAKIAARAENFGAARDLIEQARRKSYDPKAVEAAEATYREAKSAYDERKRREEEARIAREEAERRAREAQAAQAVMDASGDMGGSLNCGMVAKNYGLYRYCSTGDCGGLASDYGVYRLCTQDDPGGLAGNYAIYSYLTSGNTGGFKDYAVSSAAGKQAGSFADRKRFIIFYLNGYIYR